MSQSTNVKKLLAIPGPIELSPTVLEALGQPPLSHVSPEFVKIFQESLHLTRQVVRTSNKASQPFILAGSGTLGWDQVAANLIEKGDKVLVLSTGYFGEGFRDCLHGYGANVDLIKAPLGGTVNLEDIEQALNRKKYKAVTITHVDTSTGVLSDAKAIAACVKKISPSTLLILDAVCSLASEDIQFDAWGLDIVLSASQKGLGGPPGLSILIASARAISTFESRINSISKKPLQTFPYSYSYSYYTSWSKWLPIMRAYDQGKPAYFGTPAVTLVKAYHASLVEIMRGEVALDQRLEMHRGASRRVKEAAERLGMVQVASEPAGRANGMTAVYVPQNFAGGAVDVLGAVGKRGVVMAGGLVSEIKDRYIRIGHMGWSVVGEKGKDVDRIVRVLEDAVREVEARSRVSARL
ncbi:PLP-dependent transferase [Crepidotus variabilis]|uniref:alanine--glyoxylate transaminase n=1 Tax=Crepidotus variabilis TaxID=179855 RepID=A0A9P6E5U6_9AGAR|nr:PLP-dependent transferase [Crepidotus variabilis]